MKASSVGKARQRVRLKFVIRSIEQGWSPECDNVPAEEDEWGVLKAGCVNGWSFARHENKRLPASLEPLPEYQIRQGDVLMSRANTTELLGSAAFVADNPGKLLLCDKVYRLNVTPDALDPRFLVHFLRSADARAQMEPEATGSSNSMQNIGQDTVKNLWLPVWGLAEQRAIAEFLDRETGRLDALVVEKERWLELLAEKRRALITRAVTRGLNPAAPLRDSGLPWLGQIPQHWHAERLRWFVTRLEQGWSPQAEDREPDENDWAVLKLNAVNEGSFDDSKVKALPAGVEAPANLMVEPGDFLVTRANTPELVGDVCYVERTRARLILSDLTYRLKLAEDRLEGRFLNQFLLTPAGRRQIEADARGSSASMVKISQEHIKNWIVPIPPIEEQRAIVAHIQSATAKLDALRAATERTLALLKERRAALIAAAVTGKLKLAP